MAEPGARASSIPHIAALDGARGAAVAGVLLFHGGHLRGGYLGVDLFFTLSGFLITSLLLAESSRTGGVGLGGFWARRARRLLPALAMLMVGIVAYCALVATRDQLAQIRGDALATLAYFANWHEIFKHQNYFDLFRAPSPLNHTWSLAIEEQFYVVWPLLFVALLARWKRAVPQAVLAVTLTLAAVSTVLMIALYRSTDVSRVYYGTDTRAGAILLGAALAAWLAIHGPVASRAARVALETAGIAGVVVLAIAWTRLDGQSSTLYHGGFLLCGLAATAIIAAVAHPEIGPLARVLSWRPLCALGLVSYGLYLYHWPLDLTLDRARMGFGGWPLFGFQTAVALGVAFVSYRVVEQPIRRGALSTATLRKLTPAVAIGLVLAIVAGTAGARPAPSASVLRRPLQAATRAFDASAPGARRIMVVGDSVAYVLGQALQQIHTDPPISVFNTGIYGCAFPGSITRARFHSSNGVVQIHHTFTCDPSWQAGAIARFRPDVVLWIVDNPGDSVTYRGKTLDTCSAAYAALYERSLRAEIAAFGTHGAKVVLTTEVYPRYLFADEDRPTDCENRLRRHVAASTGVQLVDLQSYICPGGHCRTTQNGVTLRIDGEHYEGAGGRLVARWLAAQLHD